MFRKSRNIRSFEVPTGVVAGFGAVVFVLLLSCTASAAIEAEVGPYVQFTSPTTATVCWDTASANNSVVVYGSSPGSLTTRIFDASNTTTHEIILTDLHLQDKYFYRIGYNDGSDNLTDEFWFDNSINYMRVDVSGAVSPYTVDSLTSIYEAAADRIIAESGITKGFCIVYGCGEGRLAFELAKRSDMTIIGVDTDGAKLDTAVEKLMEAGVYGARVSVRQVSSLNTLPYTKYIANLIVSDYMISDGATVGSAAEMYRVLRPSGGVAYFGQPPGCPNVLTQGELESWLGSLTYTTTDDSSGVWSKVVRPDVAGAGWWTHQYGGPENNGNANDNLDGAERTSDMELQWISRPGADAKIDREVRAQGPVTKNGRLIYRGFNRLMGMDSYNGSIYWTLEIPFLMRLNIPRDAGWICIDDDYAYAAVKDDCWRIDARTGDRSLTHKLNDPGHDWGCVFRYGDKLYGSAVIENSFFDVWWGTSAWYDGTSGDPTYKICSKYLFANDASGSRVWTYNSIDTDKGVIINSTICFGGGRVYFVESRNASVESHSSGRMSLSQLWSDLYMVALDADTGTRLWQQNLKSGAGGNPVVASGIVVFYLMYSNESLLLGSSDTSYHLYAYDASDGNNNWEKGFGWASDNHGYHMDRPAVIGSNVYLASNGYNINTGAQVTSGAPSGGCGTVAGTADGLLYRGGTLAMWDISSGATSGWSDIRANCWLGMIGSGGMVLAPEGGGGCDCYGWFHTSTAFVSSD